VGCCATGCCGSRTRSRPTGTIAGLGSISTHDLPSVGLRVLGAPPGPRAGRGCRHLPRGPGPDRRPGRRPSPGRRSASDARWCPVQRDRDLVWTGRAGLAVGDPRPPRQLLLPDLPRPRRRWQRVFDPMASSLPYGAFAPAEVYDLDGSRPSAVTATTGRRSPPRPARTAAARDRQAGPGREHPAGARPHRDLRRHAREPHPLVYERTMARHVREGARAHPGGAGFLGYDAVQLLPVEPTTVYETGPVLRDLRSLDEVEATDGHRAGPALPR
jgi:hypothetical protein